MPDMTGMNMVWIPNKVGNIAIYFLYLKGEAVILWGRIHLKIPAYKETSKCIHLKKDYLVPDKVGVKSIGLQIKALYLP